MVIGDMMKIEVEKEGKDLIKVKMVDVDPYIPNLLRMFLWEDKDVTFVAFDKDHPLIGTPKLIVKGKDPKKSLKLAVEKAKKQIGEVGKNIEKEIN